MSPADTSGCSIFTGYLQELFACQAWPLHLLSSGAINHTLRHCMAAVHRRSVWGRSGSFSPCCSVTFLLGFLRFVPYTHPSPTLIQEPSSWFQGWAVVLYPFVFVFDHSLSPLMSLVANKSLSRQRVVGDVQTKPLGRHLAQCSTMEPRLSAGTKAEALSPPALTGTGQFGVHLCTWSGEQVNLVNCKSPAGT